MIPPKEILVATDHSACATAALRWAIGAAQRFDARIHVVNSCDVQRLALLAGAVIAPDEFWTRLRGSAAQMLDKACAEVRSANLECVSHLEQTEPSVAITQSARKIPADLIVMGTHGHRGPTRWMLGSTAERTLRTAPCPVLTIREPVREEKAIFERIVVPTDFSEPAKAALEVAKSLALATGAKLFLVHGYYVPVELEAWAAGTYASEMLAGLSDAGKAELERGLVDLSDAGISAEFFNLQGPPERVLHEVVSEVDATLVVIGTHGRTGFSHVALGSVAERVARTAACPVLSVPPESR